MIWLPARRSVSETAMDTAAFRYLESELGLTLEANAPLAHHSAIRVGGPAALLVKVDRTAALVRLLRWSRQEEVPYFMLGGGSNTLFADQGMDGITILNRCRETRILDDHPAAHLEGAGGMPLAQLARVGMRHGLSGMEWAVSVPGTVGGAVVGNAGAHGSDIAACLQAAELIAERPDPAWQDPAALRMAYRASRLKPTGIMRAGYRPVVTRVRFRLAQGEAATIRATARRYLRHRRRTQPTEPSLGSMFRNPPGHYAGALIERAGGKGLCCGAIAVSRRHANFFINRGPAEQATAGQVVDLMRRVRERVRDHCGIELAPEICFAGLWPQEPLAQ